ncbi:MAG: hypothetical protein ACT4RN_19770 [Pseudonocardia sp.]
MNVVLVVLLVVELGLGAVLLRRLRSLRGAAQRVHVAAQGQAIPAGGPGSTVPLITVEIRNAPELAARESWAARRFGALVPRYVEREVVARAAARMVEQLAEQGVRADVRVLEPPGPPAPGRAEELLDGGTTGVRDMHMTIAAIPFDLLDGLAPARLVRRAHDRITGGVYDAVATANRAVAAGGHRRGTGSTGG